jgi:hypothetical protein
MKYHSSVLLALLGLSLSLSPMLGGCSQFLGSQTAHSSANLSPRPTPTDYAESMAPEMADISAGHHEYVAIDLNNLRPSSQMTGEDPEAIALELFGAMEPMEGFFAETVESERINDQTVVILTQTGLPDDSIQGMRYRLEFAPKNAEQWQLTWAGKQYTCQPGRGSQTWSTEWCF